LAETDTNDNKSIKMNFDKVKRISVLPSAEYTIDSQILLNLGRSFEDSNDNFFGTSVFKMGDEIGGNKILSIATDKTTGSTEILLSNFDIIVFEPGKNPVIGDNDVDYIRNKLWENPGIIAIRASRDEVQSSPDYSLKSTIPVNMKNSEIQDMYASALDNEVKEFLMSHVGDVKDSIAESIQKRAFPSLIDEEWLRNRFLQTSSFLTEMFAFPDELTREAVLSVFLTKGGSCLLSGIPGSGKTVMTELASILFINGYGFSGYEYRAPVKDVISRTYPYFIFVDLNNSGTDKGNIMLRPPTKSEIEKPERRWCIIPNVQTTSETQIVPDKDMRPDRFREIYSALIRKMSDEERKMLDDALDNGLLIGRYHGPMVTQKYSINRIGDNLTDWEEQRFDDELLMTEGGILENEYYTRSLLYKGEQGYEINDEGERIEKPSLYISDVTYDMARYPDTKKLVKWEKEVEDEVEYIEHEAEMKKLKEDLRLGTITDDEQKQNAESRITEISKMRSHIHRMRDLPRNTWEEEYRAGRKGELSDTELENINEKYNGLYSDLMYLVTAITNTDKHITVKNARTEDEILDEMKMDIGITTCSENKTPEEILYTTEITMVTDTDAIGRPMQQYVFKPAPLDFVWKPGKFLNEFTRADKDFQDQLLSLLDRRMVEHRGQRFKSPRFILFADNNPHKLLTAQIDWALWDRLDMEVMMKGAKLGTKDMILSKSFGREDLRLGKTKKKLGMEEELLERIQLATLYLNDFDRSRIFRDTGIIKKPSAIDREGVIPLRFRELKQIWKYVDRVSIPRRVLHTVFLLTASMNQAWYMKRREVNDPNEQAKMIQFPDTELVPNNFEPYKTKSGVKLEDRDFILDHSVLSFADEFMAFSSIISNIDIDKAKDQFPLGITRPVGIRFVISLLKMAKSLAWLRRGKTEVTETEVYDVFPLVGSHRLNLMPFGEERLAGIDETMMRLFPNIQDYLKYGIVENWWRPRAKQYLDYYDDLESVIDAGFLNVDDCPPSGIASAGGKCKIKVKGSYNVSKERESQDVLFLDIQNAVEFTKRYSPEYRKHLNDRMRKIQQIGASNYYPKFLDNAKDVIQKTDLNEDPAKPGVYNLPMLLFPRDGHRLMSDIDDLRWIFDENGHMINLSTVDTRPEMMTKVALPVLDSYKNYISEEPGFNTIAELESTITNLQGIHSLIVTINRVLEIGDTGVLSTEIKSALDTFMKNRKTEAQISKMSVEQVVKTIMKHINTINIEEKYKLKQTGVVDADPGVLEVKFKPDISERFIRLKAQSMNEHLLWNHIRFGDPFEKRRQLSSDDQLK